MTFLHPELLWGLVALAVPIIVHFFYLRRSRRYVFSRADIVERLRQASRPYLRVRHLLLLLIRLALVAVLVLLFARPVGGSQGLLSPAKGTSALIVWDVSPSMKPVFETSRALVQAILREGAEDEYRLLCTDSYLPRGGFVGARVLQERVQDIQPADMGYPLATLLERADFLFQGASYPNRRVYVVSDFQRSSEGDLTRLGGKPLGEIVLVPVEHTLKGNAYIDSVSLKQIGARYQVAFRLQGTAGYPYSVQVGKNPRKLTPGLYEEGLSDTAGYVAFQIEGDGSDFDNTLYVGVEGEGSSLRVGWQVPQEAQQAFLRLHRVLGIETPPEKALTSSTIWIAEARNLPSEASRWVSQGGRLILFPPADLSSGTWQKLFLSEGVEFSGRRVSYTQPLSLRLPEASFWEPVFLRFPAGSASLAEPLQVGYAYLFRPQAGRVLIEGEDGTPLLWEIPWGRGRVYLFAFPWQVANLGAHSLFVPLFARLYESQEAGGKAWVAWLGVRKGFVLPALPEDRPLLRRVSSGQILVPSFEYKGGKVEFFLGEEPIPAGLYEVKVGNRRAYLGVQVPLSESADTVFFRQDWARTGVPITVKRWEEGSLVSEKAWRWGGWAGWVLLALLLVGMETYWARRLLRPATVPSP
ncbi:MAG: hypothetical protein KatS3mg026_0085 [Bacteroidia bacterium]|nr:MAG: hypothetical protein KatS3mg026_0085 [Bacteroidia bacterium]